MANLKSSKKDLRRSEKRRAVNQGVRTSLKTFVKKTRQAAAAGDANVSVDALKKAISALDKAVQRGVIHKNQAARRKSRIAKVAAAAGSATPQAAVAKASKPKAAAKPKAKTTKASKS